MCNAKHRMKAGNGLDCQQGMNKAFSTPVNLVNKNSNIKLLVFHHFLELRPDPSAIVS
jgi:hypothetical protein